MKKRTRLTAALLAVLMLLSCVPVSAAERLTVTERFARALSFGLRPLYPEQERYEGKNTESNRFNGPMLTQSG